MPSVLYTGGMTLFKGKKTVYSFPATPLLQDISINYIPAKKSIPNWYKDIKRTHDKDLIVEDRMVNLSVKACMPYLDALTMGYIMPLWCDIQVTQTEYGPRITWKSESDPVVQRNDPKHNALPPYPGFSEWNFAWVTPWGLQTPLGYSLLVTQPLNRPELPFMVASGVVDTDDFATPGIVSFCVHKEFEGIIEAGTPMFQAIPIKRDSWTMEERPELARIEAIKRAKNLGKIVNGYKKDFWKPKSYE